jgi:hypothetical protein
MRDLTWTFSPWIPVPMRRCQLTTYRFMRFGKAHD